MSNKRELSVLQISGGIITAILIGIVTGVIATLRTADSTAILAARNSVDIVDLKESCVPRPELETRFKSIDNNLERIEKAIIQLSVDVKSIK